MKDMKDMKDTKDTKDMKELILEKISEIEKKEDVKIIHCIESGSRAWGFPSPDSDYDVRFIYVRPKEFYLRLDKTKDFIDWQLDDTLDINGWDISKALRLLHGSNPTLFEWNSSPVIYKTTDDWKKVSSVITDYFLAKNGLYHYLSTAKKNYREFLTGEYVKYKKYFYVLRPLLACKWILDKGTPPPMLFKTLCDCYLEVSLKAEVDCLLDLKMNSPEITVGKRFEKVNAYIEKSLSETEKEVLKLPFVPKKSFEKLNEVFLSLL